MFEAPDGIVAEHEILLDRPAMGAMQSRSVWRWKGVFDIFGALLLLLPFCLVAAALVFLNPFYNRGPLFFVQERMGYRCKPFKAYKFRSMMEGGQIERGAFDGLETHRITQLGHILRKLRLDELPQVINILRGEMSLIGPRPDSFAHARVYLQQVPGYRDRHSVRPGISGLAQVEIGYVDDRVTLNRKVAADLRYIRQASVWMDIRIVFRTIIVVCTRQGS